MSKNETVRTIVSDTLLNDFGRGRNGSTKSISLTSIHLQKKSKTAISYLMKTSDFHIKHPLDIRKIIRVCLVASQIMIDTEYLQHECESRLWVKECAGKVRMGIIIKRVRRSQNRSVCIWTCYQLPLHIAWKFDPKSIAVDALYQYWNENLQSAAFTPFSLLKQILNKEFRQHIDKIIIAAPIWQTQQLPRITITNPILLPQSIKLLLSPLRKKYSLIG